MTSMAQRLGVADYSGLPDTAAIGEGRRSGATCCPTKPSADANKQRRKIQNRKNQRARRLRLKGEDPSSVQRSRPFQVTRWRLDSPEDVDGSEDTNNAPSAHKTLCIHIEKPAPIFAAETAMATIWPQSHTQTRLTPPSITFPLSTDHLLHLVQYNVFRAFVSNKRTLNLLLTGWTDAPPSPTTCPISGPYRDDTSVFPLNPNIPAALVPTLFQQAHPHPVWINLIPFPRIRENLIRCQGSFDHWEFLQDLIGELMGANQFQRRETLPLTISVSDPATHDSDTVTKGRKGLIVWGEPHEMESWEATPGFFAKWAWAVKGCDALLENSNRWRLTRGEDPICIYDID